MVNRYLENILILFSLLLLYITLQFIQLSSLCMIIGVLIFIVIPGGVLIRILNVNVPNDLFYGYSAIIGLSLQLVFIGFGYMAWMNIFNMQIYVLISTLIFLALSLTKIRLISVLKDLCLSFRKPISILYIVSITLSLYYILNFSYSSVAVDGALYCDIARNIVLRGVFKTNILNDFLAHIGTPITISLFLLFGGVSQISANITALFISTLTIYPLIDFERRIVKNGLSIVSSILYIVHPMFTLFSSMLFGPEILSILYTLITIIFLIDAIHENSIGKSVLAGLSLNSLNTCWGPETSITLLVLLITSVILLRRDGIMNAITPIIVFPSIFVCFWFYRLIHLWIPLVILSISILKYSRGSKNKYILTFYITAILASQLFLIRGLLEHPLALEEAASALYFLSSINIDVVDRLSYYISNVNLWITPPFMILTILYLTQVNSMIKAIPLIFIVSHMLLYSLYFPLGWLERRFLLSAFIMMTLTSSSIINIASSKLQVRIKITRGSRTFRIKGLNLLLAIFIIALLTLTYHTHQYQDVLKTINQSSTRQLTDLANKVMSSIDNEEIIAIHGPSRAFAWITDRKIVAIPRNTNLTGIYSIIKKYNATVLILNIDDLPIEAKPILKGGIIKLNSEYINISLIDVVYNFRIFRIH